MLYAVLPMSGVAKAVGSVPSNFPVCSEFPQKPDRQLGKVGVWEKLPELTFFSLKKATFLHCVAIPFTCFKSFSPLMKAKQNTSAGQIWP